MTVDTPRNIRSKGQGDSALSVSRVRAKQAIQQQGPREAVLVVYAVSDHSTG
ncbi:hypothetical protein [Burkholderia ubonensis]|uniref:hypothetical protein n=1 Tax=Burkholderia ubonensis TaxID=101571 RepID=UPI0012F8FE80|nr:hypothetical protein [Burkholderia ubonensis]